jgi:hypothetical protein
MTAISYSILAASIFAIVAILQLTRAYGRIPVVVGSIDIPAGASWFAGLLAGALAVAGFTARDR